MRNRAFAYLKPHAMGSQAVVSAVGDLLAQAGVRVRGMRRIHGAELAAGGYYDRQIGRLARVSLAQRPEEWPLDADVAGAFEAAFGEPLDAVLAAGRLLPAARALEQFGLVPDELLLRWCLRGAEELAPDFFVSPFEAPDHAHGHGHTCSCGHDHAHEAEQPPVYVVNGFYPAQRQGFQDASGPGVQTFLLDFDLSWTDFNETVIGEEEPAGALEESIRGYLYDRRDALDIRIDRFDNILYASGSAFEALSDQFIWGTPALRRTDPLRQLLAREERLSPRKLGPELLRLREDAAFRAAVHGLDAEETAPILIERLLQTAAARNP